MTYAVKELFYTLQGEGAQTGRAAVFCRFAGCNLWSGRESDRAAAACTFCDTDFIGTDGPGGGRYTVEALVAAALALWPEGQNHKYIVCTGGEPLLQLDMPLIKALQTAGFQVAVETNGTIAAPTTLDWVCVSPKGQSQLIQTQGDELKLVYPQQGVDPASFESLNFTHFFLQPMDGANGDDNVSAAMAYIRSHPRWRLSLQTHKILSIP
jgi:7-carboxy-7-deazaguanine synthase (Cx14CxxC type)